MKVNCSLVRFGAVAALSCCAFASFGASSSETPGWEPSYPAGFTEKKTIAAFGDSITAGSESHGDTCRSANFEGGSMKGKTTVLAYPYWLSRMVPSDFNVISTARPEMVTDSILGWQGSVDMRLVDSVTLPKGGGTVACKVWFWDEASQSLKSSLNNKRNKGLEVPTSISGWVNGHHVTYVRDGKMKLYSKDEASVTLPAGARFVPDFHYMYADSIQLLFAGHNDGESSWRYNLEMLKKAVATIPSGRFIVITSPCFTDPARKAAYIKEFGTDRYLDCYELLSTKSIQQAIDLGLLKQSERDHLTLKDGVYLLNDDLYYPGKSYPAWYVLMTGGNYSKPGPHMNALGHFIVAKALHEKLLKNGWITNKTHTHKYAALSEANSVSPPSSTEKVSYPKACGDGIALRFCTAEGCAETTAAPSHEMYPGGHAWVETSDECCNWLCDEKKSQPGHVHDYGAWTTNPAPTCVKSGTRTQSCTVAGCTAKKTETVAALGHDFVETSRTATQVNYKCSRCTATKTELLDHTHTYGAWSTNPPPTCVEGGLRTRTCTSEGCEEKIEEELPPTGHVWIETQRQAGEIHYECANCPEVKMEFYDEPEEPQGDGDPDTSAVTYVWKGGASAAWSETANWQANATPSFGYPDSYAFATADFAGDAAVDLEGCSFSVVNLTMAAGASVTLASGSLSSAATAIVSEGGSLTLRDVTLNQSRITPAKGSTLVLAGNCSLVTGKTGANGLRPFNKGGETIRVVDGETTISSTSTDASCKNGGALEIDNATLTVEAHFQIDNLNLSLRDGADRAARLIVGKNADIDFPRIDLVLPAAGWTEAPIAVGTTAAVSPGVVVAVDATACASLGTYPILSAGTLSLPEGGVAALTLNATCASGFSASLAVSGNTLNLVLSSGGEEPPTHEHVWGEGSVTTEPTCVTPGVRTFHCSGCAETKTEQIAIDPDNHLWATEPYKTEGGFDYYTCTRTGCTAEKQEKAEEPGPGPEPEPTDEDWGWSNLVTVAGTDYCVLAFTNTAASGFVWTVPAGVSAFRYLVVGGGGSGGSGGKASSSSAGGGGGGAGGLCEGTVQSAAAGSSYVIRVGAGGLAPTEAAVDGGDGADSSISLNAETVACAHGGGGGGAGVYVDAVTTEGRRGHDGGCGGGGGGCNTNDAVTAVMVPAGGAALDAEAGFGGGSGSLRSPGNNQSAGGGGGGAGAAGGKAAYNSPGAGGDGKVSDITGADVCYAGGGSGAFGKSGTKAGGAGGGGTGGVTPTAGVDGLGAGGGGARGVGAGNGGSGIVIIRYAVSGGEEPGPGPGPGPGPEPTEYEYGEPDGETAVTYTWKGGATGAWANPANWQPDLTPCYGIPSNAVAKAVFASGAVIDLANGAYPVKDITINGASTVEVKGGTIGHSSVQFKYDGKGSTLRLRDAHLVSNRIGVGDSTCFECVGASTLAGAQNYGFRPWGNSGHVLYVHDGETTVSEMHGYTKSSDRGLVKVENAVLSVAPSACDLTAGYDLSLDAVSRLAVKGASLTYAFGTTTLTLPTGGWANPPVYAYRAATVSAGIAFVVDATACTTPGSYPLIVSDTAVALPEGGLSALTLNATCAAGFAATLAADEKTLYLVVSESGSGSGVVENRWQDDPSLEKTSWNEDEAPSAVNLGRPAYGRVLVSYDYGVTEIPVAPGEHVAHFVVEPATGWTGLSRDIAFTIADTAPQPGEVRLPAGFDAAHTIVCYGDSITEGYSSTNVTLGVCPNYHDGRYDGERVQYSYPYVLSRLVPSSFNVVNQSHGGMETDAILAWQGGVMVRSTADITLKANGTSYTSCPTNLLFDGRSVGTADSDRCKGMQSPTLSAFGATEDIVSGWMNGQHVAFNGGARWNNAKMRLYGPAESDVTIPAGSRFISDNAIAYKDAVQVFFVGQNDKVANYRRYLPLIRQAVAKIPSQRYVVVSTHSSRSEEMEAAFAEAFGEHYLNLYQEMDTRGLETALALGIMPQEDYDSRESFAETHGYPMWYWYLTENSSAAGGDARKYPGIHFNSKGYRVTGQFIYEKLNALGYLNDSPEPVEPLSAAEWTAYVQGVDTAEKLAAVKAAVAGKSKVKIAFANSATSIPGGGTPHDTFEQNEMLKQAAYFGLGLEIVRIQPADPSSGRTMDVVYREAVNSADIVCDFSSYWDDEEGKEHDGNARELAAKVIAENTDKLFILPYGEISSCPPTGTSLQGMAQHRDGTGFKNVILTSPLAPSTGGKLTYVARRTEGDTETITFVIPSGWAAGTGDTCRSASMAGVLAAWIWSARGDSPTAAEIIKLMADARALPAVSKVTGFTAEHLDTLKSNLAAYVAVDEFGRSKLIYDKPVNMANVLALLQTPDDPEPDTVVPGESKAYSDEAAAQAAAAKSKVGVPAAVAEKLDAAQQADYVKCFKIVTRKTADNRWVNAAVLTEATEAALQEQVDQGAVKVLSSLTGNTLTLSPVTPGFYYTLLFGESLGGMVQQPAQMATDVGGLTLDLPKGSSSGFYRVIASESAK